jgi:hypothetical protein
VALRLVRLLIVGLGNKASPHKAPDDLSPASSIYLCAIMSRAVRVPELAAFAASLRQAPADALYSREWSPGISIPSLGALSFVTLLCTLT